ncbi:hypothetical protein F2P56_033293 [Juglans regia]|uniref:Uncharacterized protein n=2 Tax=Juglans regia TaxID=51240 RepID=A0A833TEU6_JUGRE|nr:uncharacterized protein LOC108994586 isoform X3 [Juglans regia]KAF5447755.1 hypothetical protein F2P56_033280 [Juglans regia]KAF5447769.1 hypothetical protein F2P56_033293 [Juglans regia]
MSPSKFDSTSMVVMLMMQEWGTWSTNQCGAVKQMSNLKSAAGMDFARMKFFEMGKLILILRWSERWLREQKKLDIYVEPRVRVELLTSVLYKHGKMRRKFCSCIQKLTLW